MLLDVVSVCWFNAERLSTADDNKIHIHNYYYERMSKIGGDKHPYSLRNGHNTRSRLGQVEWLRLCTLYVNMRTAIIVNVLYEYGIHTSIR